MENKTAVEWLMSKLALRDNCPFQAIAFYQDNKEFVEQAKEMFKEQIERANFDGFVEGVGFLQNDGEPKSTEKYYNETYGK